MKLVTSTKERGKAFEKVRIPEDMYEAKFLEVKDISQGEYGDRVAFIFHLEERNVDLAFVCYKRDATKDNKMGQVLSALGVPIDGSEVNTDHLTGRKVKVMVEDYTYDLDGEKKIASTISKVKSIMDAPIEVIKK